jgi:radical SAM superfamily enzyme YgiQ (UPF0313 family)
LAEKVKSELNPLIIFGGPHPSIFPQETLQSKFVDLASIGEGEYLMVELVNALENGQKII